MELELAGLKEDFMEEVGDEPLETTQILDNFNELVSTY